MSRLPQPGSDDGVWGTVLNDFLGVAHNADGTLKSGSISKSSVGLDNVDNTSDANKPVSTATQTALDLKANASELTNYYTSAQVNTILRSTEAVILYNSGSSSYPARSTVTTDVNRPVRWRGPVAPTIGGAYAVDGLDVWEMTP